MFHLIRQTIRDNPVRVRTALGALLVLVGHYIPAVADVAVNDQAVDAITFLVLLLLGEGASRKMAAKYNPAPVPEDSRGDGSGRESASGRSAGTAPCSGRDSHR
ncbi:hypothetical protein GCM10010211_12530 [Streptomyces albospinus]|uniref:Holin n=1 Tax=Streptomyces albospinus TaxID=285515 RepID=A0ABQ2US08_9ACTN|nr:hypothetical protein [Streptomyces albospinus]GGU49798.1 hypothetical protein GCM10010211_12530 [Streptomyces albospinus]